MPSARDIIKSSMQDLGVLAAGREPSPDDLNECFTRLNRMVSGWTNQRATIFEVRRLVFPLSANTQSYSIGPGATFNTIRPVLIDKIGFIMDRTATLPIELGPTKPWTNRDFAMATAKGVGGNVPYGAYYDFAFNGADGWGNLQVFPIPSVAVCDIVLYLPIPMQQFADLSTIYAFPPGYEEAVVSHLAIRCAALFQTKASDETIEIARDSMAWIKRTNNRPREMGLDPALTGMGRPYNIYTDQ